jgi:hypothetical protein
MITEEKKDKLAKRRFKKLGLAVLEVSYESIN